MVLEGPGARTLRTRVGAVVARTRLGGVLLAATAALALSQAVGAAPERNEAIRMGMGIGKIQRGMTLPAVRRALGGPHVAVYRRDNFGARGRYIELGWELPGRTSWDPITWQVGFRSTSRRGPLRVTRVATSARSQRTPRGLGVGSRARDIKRAYPDATCVERFHLMPHPFKWIVVDTRRGITAFQVVESDPSRSHPTPFYVTMVMVQGAWFSKGWGHMRCDSGWEDW
jgi:hypothetical protein